jgi:hypothetical protein
LAALAGAKQRRAFVAQLLAVICTDAERTFTVVSQPRDAATTVTMPGLSWKWSGLADQAEDHRTRDRRLLEYVTACRRATEDVQHLTLCTDKGISGALPLQMTMFVMQESLAMVGCPQVVGSQACLASSSLAWEPRPETASSVGVSPPRRHWWINYCFGKFDFYPPPARGDRENCTGPGGDRGGLVGVGRWTELVTRASWRRRRRSVAL